MPEIGANKKHTQDIVQDTITVIRTVNTKGELENSWPKM